MKNILSCPLCSGNTLDPYLTSRDYFLTKEEFTITQCRNCGFRFTNPRPETEKLPVYYESGHYISHSATRRGIVSKLYLLARSFTVKKKFRFVSKLAPVTKGRILDIGCGTGELLATFKKNGWESTGIEPNEIARREATKNYGLSVFEPSRLKILPSGHYSVISLWHVMEHIDNLADTMNEIRRLLDPEGIIIVAVPNSNALDARIYGNYWAAWDVPRHLYHFTRQSMDRLFSEYGFQLLNVYPMKLDAYYVSLLSEKYKKGKIRYLPAAISGLRSNWYAKFHNHEYSSMIFAGKPK
jgi:SAM-dependent methyltransferase